ncbi:MAG: CpaD family pilus assembly lipoprotein [Alphaproteobacteria bacterium]
MLRIIPLLAVCFSVTACEMYSESVVSDRRIQVREEKFSQQVPVSELNTGYVTTMAREYAQSGMGPVNLTITYDPASKTNTAMRASNEAVRVSRALRKEGVKNVVTSVLPVREQQDDSVAIISYSSYQAAAPANCGQMPGMESTILEHDPNYKLGCTVEAQFAEQISDPSDLLGDAKSSPYSDGRASSNVVEGYRTGATNKPLDGVTATE